MSKNSHGFILLETILSIGLIGVLAGLSVPVYQQLQIRNSLDVAEFSYAESLRRAKVLSESSDGDSTWGVYATTSSITLFKGTSYSSRTQSSDEVTEVPSSITPSGVLEVTFSILEGEPSTTGTTTFTSSNNETRDVFINSKGAVFY